MWRHAFIPVFGPVLGIAFAFALLACGDGSDTPASSTATLTPLATATETTESGKISDPQPCPPRPPAVSLQYNDQRDDGRRISTNWIGDGCVRSAHPVVTIPLPASVLTLPAGARPVLAFTETPIAVDGVARPLPVDKITASASGIEISIDDLYADPELPLEMQGAAEQELDLGALPPGDWVLQLSAEWPGGRLGFVFRVEIVEAVAE